MSEREESFDKEKCNKAWEIFLTSGNNIFPIFFFVYIFLFFYTTKDWTWIIERSDDKTGEREKENKITLTKVMILAFERETIEMSVFIFQYFFFSKSSLVFRVNSKKMAIISRSTIRKYFFPSLISCSTSLHLPQIDKIMFLSLFCCHFAILSLHTYWMWAAYLMPYDVTIAISLSWQTLPQTHTHKRFFFI